MQGIGERAPRYLKPGPQVCDRSCPRTGDQPSWQQSSWLRWDFSLSLEFLGLYGFNGTCTQFSQVLWGNYINQFSGRCTNINAVKSFGKSTMEAGLANIWSIDICWSKCRMVLTACNVALDIWQSQMSNVPSKSRHYIVHARILVTAAYSQSHGSDSELITQSIDSLWPPARPC